MSIYPDISHHHPVTNWKKVKEKCPFLISKATQRTNYIDSTLDSFIRKCEEMKIPYWLYAFLEKGDCVEQVEYMVSQCKGKIGSYFRGYIVDAEIYKGSKPTDHQVLESLRYLHGLGGKYGLYYGYTDYNFYADSIVYAKADSNCFVWEARYGKNDGTYHSEYSCHDGVDLHQFTSLGECDGISGKIDLNRLVNKSEKWFTGKEETKMKCTADKVIAVAKAEDGYLEKKSNKDLESKTKNAGKNNYTKYGAWFGANGVYWCAIFICWCFYIAYGAEKAKKLLLGAKNAACETLRQRFIKAGQYHTKDPKPGDLVFFKGTRHAGANHIALVIKVLAGYIYTEEGNTSSDKGVVDNGGSVNQKKYKISDSKILGYGRPNYDTPTEKKEASTKTATTYYKKYTGKSAKVDEVFKSVGVPEKYRGSASKRMKIAIKNGIVNYKGSAEQNLKLISLAKNGKLKKA